MAGTEGDIEAGCERVTSPVLRAETKRGLVTSDRNTDQGKGEEQKSTLVRSQCLSTGIAG
jgi:hypothetical protein